jgi:hypothetical protein
MVIAGFYAEARTVSILYLIIVNCFILIYLSDTLLIKKGVFAQ